MNETTSSPEMVVVVLSYNGLADTRKCLTSLAPALRPFVLPLLVDNGSTDGTSEAVAAEFPWCRIVRVEVNRGPVAGNNAGIGVALETGAKWIMLLNNDTTVHPQLFDLMREAALAHPEFDVLGPVINFMDDPDVVMTDATLFNVPRKYGFFLRKEVPLTRQRPPAVTECELVNGCCMMISREIVNRVGFFDESLFMYHDEADYCLRILKAGGRLGVIDHELIWHKGSASSKQTGKKSIRYLDMRNLWPLLRKYGSVPRESRGLVGSTFAYFRYGYYWYCAERDAGNEACVTATIDGVSDALTGTAGPYVPRRRPFAWFIRFVYSSLRTLQGPGQKTAAVRPS